MSQGGLGPQTQFWSKFYSPWGQGKHEASQSFRV